MKNIKNYYMVFYIFIQVGKSEIKTYTTAISQVSIFML